MPPQLVPSDEPIDRVSCDILVVPCFSSDDGPALPVEAQPIDDTLEGHLSEHLRAIGFKGKPGEVARLSSIGRLAARSIAVVGIGPQKEVSAHTVRGAAGAAARKLGEHPDVASAIHLAVDDSAGAAAEGYLLGSYRFTTHKSDPRPSKIQRITFVGGVDTGAIERAQITSDAVILARDLTNEPPAVVYPESLARKAEEIADVGDFECEIFDEERLEKEGFGGLLGVAQGSIRPPRFIRLHYKPRSAKGKVVLVGKGVTFDSGGLSIKDAKGMETMKTDMAGAAAVLATMSTLPKLGVNVEVVGLVPATENMPGGNAIKPGDVITHYGGRTSEVLNTDAEGRLILADALAYASEMAPDAVVDVATLTGGIMVALGRKATGLFSNDDELTDELKAAADRGGERVWHMPIYTDYRSELDSEVADIKNTGSRYGSAIFGALFLRDFVADGVRWAHLDIAGAARAESDYDETPRGGTGAATRTLIAFVEGRSR